MWINTWIKKKVYRCIFALTLDFKCLLVNDEAHEHNVPHYGTFTGIPCFLLTARREM